MAKSRGTPRLKRRVRACCRGKLVSFTPKWSRRRPRTSAVRLGLPGRANSAGTAHSIVSTSAPWTLPLRSRSSAVFAWLERKGLDLGSHRDPMGKREEFVRRPGASGLRPTAAARSPQRRSYENDGMSLMWMPAHTTVPPLRDSTECERDERADRREDDRRVELLGKRLVRYRRPSPHRGAARTPGGRIAAAS